jgi:hypothetical protein
LLNRFKRDEEAEMELFQLVAASEAARRRVERSFDAPRRPPAKAEPEPPRRARVRSTSAAALRTLADRLEPSPS